MNDRHTVIQSVLAESNEDFVGLWLLVRRMREEFLDRSHIRDLVLSALEVLLSEYGLLIGDFKQDEFLPWRCTPSEAVNRVDTEWQSLGRDPDVGEIAWLVSPNSQNDNVASSS